MTTKTLFLLIFIGSITIGVLFFFFPIETVGFLSRMGLNHQFDYTFISLVSLLSSILSYIGYIISLYISEKKERARLEKLARERKNLNQIQKELEELMSQA